jgi:hypothetical protein
MATPGRSSIAIDIEGLRGRWCPVGPKGNLLDAHLGRLQASLAMPLELVAALIELDRLIKRGTALLKRADNAFKLGQGLLEAHFFDGNGVHRRSLSPRGAIGKRRQGVTA